MHKIGSKDNDFSVTSSRLSRARSFIYGIKGGKKLGPLEADTVSLNSENIISELAEISFADKDLFEKYLNNIVNFGTDKNPELKQKRMSYLSKYGKKNLDYIEQCVQIGIKDAGCGAFLLDHAEEIIGIIKEKKIPRIYRTSFLECLNEKTYPEFIELSKKDDLNGQDLMSIVMYDSKEHKIEFGDEIVKVPTSEIISLLTGINSLSTIKSGSYDEFNSAVQKLVAKDYKTGELQYSQIAEGILTQEPRLVEVAEAYEEFCKGLEGSSEPIEKMESFMNSLDKYGFSEELSLKTIVPDENALIDPSLTRAVFKNKLAKE